MRVTVAWLTGGGVQVALARIDGAIKARRERLAGDFGNNMFLNLKLIKFKMVIM
jgi:hypothetical protein